MRTVQKLLFVGSSILLLTCAAAYASLSPRSTPLLEKSPDLRLEREMLHKHLSNVLFNQEHYEQMVVYKQPVNKGEPCKVSSEVFDNRVTADDGSFVLWEGACSQGFADGFGRLYLVRSSRPVLELLAKLDASSSEMNTVYYFKDNSVQGQTIFFYGKSNRHKASGITITQRELDNNFMVAMLSLDKDNLVTYQKETSLNSKYVLDTMGLTNYSHIVYDLRNSSYHSLDISYKMVDAHNRQIGYSVVGAPDGSITGELVQTTNQRKQTIEPSDDMLKRIIEVVSDIDRNIEDSLKNVLEAQPVIEVYKQVVCSTDYNSTLCDKLQCKNICSEEATISPNDPRVKELLLYLVHHHNSQAIRSYLSKAIAQRQNEQNLSLPQDSQPVKKRTDPVFDSH